MVEAGESGQLAEFKGERHLRILAILEERRRAGVHELGQALGVSQVTVRRDLRELDRQGLLLNVRGGALAAPRTSFELPYAAKLGELKEEKARIARLACSRIKPGETVLLDAGTTVGGMAALMELSHLTVITNALNVLNVLAQRGATSVLAIGGDFRQLSQAFLGPSAVAALGRLRIDRAFLGVEGLSLEHGLQVPDAADAAYKQAAVRAAREVVVLADHSKFEAERLYSFAAWSDVSELITGHETEAAHLEALRATGVVASVA